jgi:hypothetical protein
MSATTTLKCTSCGHVFATQLDKGEPIPSCESCGGITTVLRVRMPAWNKGLKRNA